jgi:hypothetical protein
MECYSSYAFDAATMPGRCKPLTNYEDPADDTDEDLSKVPEDYGQSRNTKKLKTRLQDRWVRSVLHAIDVTRKL